METAESAVPSAQQTANRKKDDREGPNAVSPLAALTHDRPEALLYKVYKRYISRPSAAAQYSEFLSTIVPIPHSSTLQATLPAFWCSFLLQVFDSGGNVHKPIWVIALLALGIAMVGCGDNGTNSTNVNGNWSASLTDSQNGAPTYT